MGGGGDEGEEWGGEPRRTRKAGAGVRARMLSASGGSSASKSSVGRAWMCVVRDAVRPGEVLRNRMWRGSIAPQRRKCFWSEVCR